MEEHQHLFPLIIKTIDIRGRVVLKHFKVTCRARSVVTHEISDKRRLIFKFLVYSSNHGWQAMDDQTERKADVEPRGYVVSLPRAS